MLTLIEEIALQYGRISNSCSSCGAPPADGVAHKEKAIIKLAAGSLISPLCESCAAALTERVRDQLISHEAAALFGQSPDDVKALSEEIATMNKWIATHSRSGEPCDECGQPLVAGDPISIVNASAVRAGMSLGDFLFVVCPDCAEGKQPRIRAASDRFLARLVSKRAAAFIPNLINPVTVVQ